MTLQLWIAVLIGLAASAEDLLRRQISNWIPIAALAGGLLWQVVENGWWGVVAALLGAASGFGIFLVFYLLGGMGGGDVKLMAGFGALLGAGALLEAALWTAICGALLAVAVLGADWIRRRRSAGGSSRAVQSIPYAPAITMGVWLTLLAKA
ncbi:MAG: prepilin peptidase [Bryobacteraceae bacterium]